MSFCPTHDLYKQMLIIIQGIILLTNCIHLFDHIYIGLTDKYDTFVSMHDTFGQDGGINLKK